MARVEAAGSKHPDLPQTHGYFPLTLIWPISPANPSAERISPSMISAAAMPVPTGIKIALRAPCAAPLRISATAAVRTS